MSITTERDILEVNEDLLVTVETMHWSEKRNLAASLEEQVSDGNLREEIVPLIHILADDPKWEVRQEVAKFIPFLAEERFRCVIDRLLNDSNSYVRRLAEQGRKRQQAVRTERRRRQRDLDQVAAMFARMEKQHGMAATQLARKIGDRLYDLLVGATVHNMRGTVTSLKSDAKMMTARLSTAEFDETAMRKLMLRITEGMCLFKRLIDEMQAYSRPVLAKRRRERLIDLVSEAVSNAQNRFEERGFEGSLVAVEVSVPESLTLDAVRHQLVVALTNLLDNSFDAFLSALPERQFNNIQIAGRLNGGGEIELTIADNGVGFGAEELKRIRQFLPGEITLKTDGTGFGLPTAKRYLAAHGGTLHIESEPEVGTTVTITLPREYHEEVTT